MSGKKPPRGERWAQLRRMVGLIVHYGWRVRWVVGLVLVLGVLTAFSAKAPLVLVGQVIQKVVVGQGLGGGIAGGKLQFLEKAENQVLHLIGLETPEKVETEAARIQAKRNTLLAVGILAVLLAVVGGLSMYFYFKLSHYLALRVVVDLRTDLAAHLLKLGLGFFARRKLGDLISRVANDTAVTLRTFSLVFENMLLEPLQLLGNFALAAIALHSFWLALLVILALPVMAVPIYRFGRRVRKGSGKSLEAMADSIESMSQMFGGIRTVQAFQAEEREIQAFREINERFLKRYMSMIRAKAASHGTMSFIYQGAFALLILVLGWYSVDPASRFMDPGDMAILTLALTTSYTHVKRVTRSYTIIMESLAATERIHEMLSLKPEVETSPDAVRVDEIRGDVEFEHVSFAYEEELVLKDVSFKAPAGRMTAVVGPSGAGKTTLMDLIARFYDPTEGRILVDGIPLTRIDLESYRAKIALVSQVPFLFNTTILENIRYARPDATEEEVIEAAKAAQIHDFITQLPDGYETIVGERGARLSGGQLQRITVARAILKKASILLLDEATSSLDSESERALQQALDNLMRGKTSFVIAHRLSTVRGADWILVLNEGRLVEQGTHEELLSRGGLYKRLYDLQFSPEAVT